MNQRSSQPEQREWLANSEDRVRARIEQISTQRISTVQSNLIHWFHKNGRSYPWRKRSATKYHQVIAEMLLQRTKADAVARIFPYFLGQFPSWKKLAMASEEQIGLTLKPLGLWRRRSTSLKAFAVAIWKLRGRFPKTRETVQDLPGVGQYICNSILMFDQGACHPLLDVNMVRVLERVFGSRVLADIRYDPYLQRLASMVVQHKDPKTINWAFLDLAALICTIRKPHCEDCPLKLVCRYALENRRVSGVRNDG